MKEKETTNVEDILAQLNNTRTQQNALISLYNKLNSAKISNVQRTRLLKTVALHCLKDGNSTDLRVAALTSVLPSVHSVFSASCNPGSGAEYYLLETCTKIVKEYIAKSSSQHIDVVVKALEIISLVNAATVSKLFSEDNALPFTKFISTCLNMKELRLHALTLLAVGLSIPSSEAFAETVSADIVPLIQLVYPLIFNVEDKNVHCAALRVMKGLKLSTKPQPFWNELKEETQKNYCERMKEMVNNKENWPDVWKCIVNLFGEELHSGGQLINHMLEVLERAFKHSDFEWTRVQAFECWNTLIDNFKTGLKNRKRIDLIMIPLKANNHRIETLSMAKLKTYDHLLSTLGKDLVSSPDILTNFFTFCFGSEKTSCPPVKSYPALHDQCVKCILDILLSPYGEEMFKKAHKELVTAVGECFIMECASDNLLSHLWDRLLELASRREADVLKTVFTMVNSLIVRTGNKGITGSLKLQQAMSPSKQTTKQLNEDLGRKIAVIIVHGLVEGSFSLNSSLFKIRSLYVGSYDVMNGTISLLLMEWLSSPAVMLGAGDLPKYNKLVSKILKIRYEESSGFIGFAQLVLKKLLVFDESINSDKKTLVLKYATQIWCTLADVLNEFLRCNGSMNEGNAADHDFSGIYLVLLFPVHSLYVDLKFIEQCSESWSNLFYEVCQQAELEPTASLKLLCEQLFIRFASVAKKHFSWKQCASIYLFSKCVLEVALKRFKSKKSFKWVQQNISVLLKDMNDLTVDQHLIFDQAADCIEHCLKQTPITLEVVVNVSPTVCSLLQAKTNTIAVEKLCTLIGALKDASLFIHQHGSSKELLKGVLQNVVKAGETHTSQEIKSIVADMCNTFNEKISEDEEKSPSVKNKGAFSPSSRGFSPKLSSKKFPTVQMSPSNLSPGGTKRKLQATVCGSDGKFVRIETPPKKIILTEHQKEVKRERRWKDIPALYQDLSQDTQSMSQDSTQDFVALPATPKGKCGPVLDEDAVMDVVHLNTSKQGLPSKKMASPKRTETIQADLEPKSELKNFTPPAGFLLPSTAEDSKAVANVDSQDLPSSFKAEILPGKENENVTPTPKSVKLNKPSKGTLTRSSSNTSLTTRSGKIMKRASIGTETEVPKTRKYTRKSLPMTVPEESLKKGAIETVALESDTDTESVSSAASEACGAGKTLSRSRRSLKREVSLESDTDIQPVKEKMREPKNGTGKFQKDVFKSESSENKVASDTEQSKSDTEDVPLSQLLIGGKILTRSRSNSSLDDVAPVRKSKISSPDSKDKALSPAVESNSELKKSPALNDSKSPQKNSNSKKSVVPGVDSEVEVSPTGKKNHTSNITACVSPTINGLEKHVKTSDGAQITSKNLDLSSPKCIDKLFSRLPSVFQLSSQDDKPSVEKGKKTIESLGKTRATSSPPGSSQRKESNGSDSNDQTQFDNCTEESQEIIESSQEPMFKCLKPCLVSLEHFRCTDANETVEFENLTIEKGPKPNSPYKIVSKESSPVEAVKQNSACRRSLILDGTEKPSLLMVKEVVSPPKSSTVTTNKSPTIDKQISVSDEITSDNASKKLSSNADLEVKGTSKNKEGKEQDLSANGEENTQVRNDSMPEWMHNKKNSPLTKSQRTSRIGSARSQAFMKSVTDNGNSSSPPKAVEVSPLSSPSQSKRLHKSSMDSNTTPIIKRSSRAAQLLGLGQAAAARGGDTVVSSASRSLRMDKDKTSENDETETLCNNGNSIPSSSVASSAAGSLTNTVLSSVSSVTTPVASPSVRRLKLLDLESLKSTPQKCLEDKGIKEDWVPSVPVPTATPDTSILKRKRDVDSDAPSPSVKRKRVSFRDPPLSKLLKFGEISEGTVFTSDHSDQPTGTVKVSEIPNVDDEECPSENREDETEVNSNQICKSLGVDMESKVKEKGSPQGKKENCVESNSPLKSDSIPHDKEATACVVVEKSPEKSSEVLSRRKAPHGTINDKPQINNEMEVDLECLCDDDQSPCSGSEQSEVEETQGMLDDLHRMPSILTPICANLITCTHPVELISSKLTSAVWKKSLLRQFSDGQIRTIGDLASLTEEQLDRLSVKPPKRTNVCCVLEDFEKQHSNLTDGVSCKLLTNKSTSSVNVEKALELEDILTSASTEDIMNALSKAGTKSDICQRLLQSLPPRDVVDCFKMDDLIKFFKLEDLVKFYKPEDLIKFFKAEDVIKFFKTKDVLQFFKPEDVINSLKVEDVAQAVGLNNSVIRSLPVDVCAEAYISQVNKSSGLKEKEMSGEQLASILNRVAGGTIQSTIFPSEPSLLSTVYTDAMRDYVMRECSSSEIVQKLDSKKAKECALKLLPKLKPKVLAEQLDSIKAAELTAELLPKLSPSVISELIDNDMVEETVKALLSKLNPKRSLKFLLDQSVNTFDKLE